MAYAVASKKQIAANLCVDELIYLGSSQNESFDEKEKQIAQFWKRLYSFIKDREEDIILKPSASKLIEITLASTDPLPLTVYECLKELVLDEVLLRGFIQRKDALTTLIHVCATHCLSLSTNIASPTVILSKEFTQLANAFAKQWSEVETSPHINLIKQSFIANAYKSVSRFLSTLHGYNEDHVLEIDITETVHLYSNIILSMWNKDELEITRKYLEALANKKDGVLGGCFKELNTLLFDKNQKDADTGNLIVVHFNLILKQNRKLKAMNADFEFQLFKWFVTILQKLFANTESLSKTKLIYSISSLVVILDKYNVIKTTTIPKETVRQDLLSIVKNISKEPMLRISTMKLVTCIIELDLFLIEELTPDFSRLYLTVEETTKETENHIDDLMYEVVENFVKLQKCVALQNMLFDFLNSNINNIPLSSSVCCRRLEMITQWLENNINRVDKATNLDGLCTLLKWLEKFIVTSDTTKMPGLVNCSMFLSEMVSSVILQTVISLRDHVLRDQIENPESISQDDLSIFTKSSKSLHQYLKHLSCQDCEFVTSVHLLILHSLVVVKQISHAANMSESLPATYLAKMCNIKYSSSWSFILSKRLQLEHLKYILTNNKNEDLQEGNIIEQYCNSVLNPPTRSTICTENDRKEWRIGIDDVASCYVDLTMLEFQILSLFASEDALQQFCRYVFIHLFVESDQKSASTSEKNNLLATFTVFDNPIIVNHFVLCFFKTIFTTEKSKKDRNKSLRLILKDVIASSNTIKPDNEDGRSKIKILQETYFEKCCDTISKKRNPTQMEDMLIGNIKSTAKFLRHFPPDYLSDLNCINLLDVLIMFLIELNGSQHNDRKQAVDLSEQILLSMNCVLSSRSLARNYRFWRLLNPLLIVKPLLNLSAFGNMKATFTTRLASDIIGQMLSLAFSFSTVKDVIAEIEKVINSIQFNFDDEIGFTFIKSMVYIFESLYKDSTSLSHSANKFSVEWLINASINPLQTLCQKDANDNALSFDELPGSIISTAANLLSNIMKTFSIFNENDCLESYRNSLQLCVDRFIELGWSKLTKQANETKDVEETKELVSLLSIGISYGMTNAKDLKDVNIFRLIDACVDVIANECRENKSNKLEDFKQFLETDILKTLSHIFLACEQWNQTLFIRYISQKMAESERELYLFKGRFYIFTALTIGHEKGRLTKTLLKNYQEITTTAIYSCKDWQGSESIEVVNYMIEFMKMVLQHGKGCLAVFQITPMFSVVAYSTAAIELSSTPHPRACDAVSGLIEMLTNMVFFHPTAMMQCISPFLAALSRILIIIGHLSSNKYDSLDIKESMVDLHKKLSRLFQQMGNLKTPIKKYIPFIMKDYIILMTTSKRNNVSVHEGIYNIMETGTDLEFSRTMAYLDSGAEQLYFTDLHKEFIRHFHYKGKS